jgi:pSer/pThr/pTyr-binding forkhead associated (FHA) protein
MARLILNCEGVGLVMRELGRDIIMVGRAPLNQIVIDHPTVSAQHAVLLRTGRILGVQPFATLTSLLAALIDLRGPPLQSTSASCRGSGLGS